MSSDTVPFFDSLDSIYDSTILDEQKKRYKNVYDQFISLYKSPPSHIVRAPGRVNLIVHHSKCNPDRKGEHIDYSNFSVLPMAIAPDILLAISISKDSTSHTISLANTNPRFPKRQIQINTASPSHPVEIDSKTLEWSNYFKAGYLGHATYVTHPSFHSMQILIDGTIPTGSGLSSSAAFVVSSLIASLLSTSLPSLPKRKIVQLAMTSERNVGVNSGGMDQAASVFGEKEKAVFVQFAPELKGETVPFADGREMFVIANSLVNADKHDTAPENYNLRVVETTVSAVVLARRLGLGELTSRDGFGGTLEEVVRLYYRDKRGGLEDQLEMFEEVVRGVFEGDGEYTLSELSEMMGLKKEELVEKYMTRFPVRAEKFKLLARTRHVLSEARRVLLFRNLLSSSSEDLFTKLGSLMDDSQTSCREDFQCSCPELDELCQMAKKHGAYGARLTGAGWGGAIVALTTKEEAPKVVDGLIKEYYHVKFPKMSEEELRKAVFATQPGSGASVFVVGEKDIQ